jgi:hypothetical protein
VWLGWLYLESEPHSPSPSFEEPSFAPRACEETLVNALIHNFTVTLWDMNYQPTSAGGMDTGIDKG